MLSRVGLFLLAGGTAVRAACDAGPNYSYLTIDATPGGSAHGTAKPVAARCSLPSVETRKGEVETIPLAVFVASGSLMCSATDVDAARKAATAAIMQCGSLSCQPILLVDRGVCTFETKLNHSSHALEGLGTSGMAPTVLVIDNQCGPFVSMAVDGLDAPIRSAFCPIEAGVALMALEGQPQRLQLSMEISTDRVAWDRTDTCPPETSPASRQCSFQWDASLAALLVLATATVVIGSRESGKVMMDKLQARMPSSSGAERPPPPRPEEDTSVVITARMASFYCVFASCGLLLMYMFMESIVMFMVCYVIFVSSCVAAMLTSGWLVPHLSARRVTLPAPVQKALCGFGKDVPVSELIIYVVCAMIGLGFFINRHEPWSWVLQDFLCLNLCIYVIRTFELPNAKVAAILLGALFVYDIFWVYISPYIVALVNSWDDCSTAEDLATDPNNSVMVHVAKGVPASDNKPQESIPIVIRMPRWSGASGSGNSESMLGLGDIIIPALSTAMLWRFDIAAGRSWSGPLWLADPNLPAAVAGGATGSTQRSTIWPAPHPQHFLSGYFVPSLIGYVFALCCAYFVVANWCLAQPALLYIVPLSLWTVLGLAQRRGDLKQLWSDGPYSDGGLKQTNSPPPPNTCGGGDSGRETGMGEGLLGGGGVTSGL